MTETGSSRVRLERMYAAALRLYPAAFRREYSDAMRQAFRDAMKDGSIPRGQLAMLVLRDLVVSLIKEHWTMVRDSLRRPAIVFNALVLAGLATGLALALYAIPQHVLRSGLDDPQLQLAQDVSARLEQGTTAADAVPSGATGANGSIDMAKSLAPFVIVYDDEGRPLVSQAQLNGTTPAPPRGVFDYVRQHGEEKLSWQPVLGSERGVRIATVVHRVNGAHPGFVLAGRNMREVETRIGHVQDMAGLTWLGMLGLIVIGSVAFAVYARSNPA